MTTNATTAFRLEDDVLSAGGLRLCFQRTLRLPDDGRVYPLPPGLGMFPVLRVSDFADRVPEGWRAHGGVFIPMWQREAMWLSFAGTAGPLAVKIAAGMVNAVSGSPWEQRLTGAGDQDYVVCPPQPWLDGFKTAGGQVRQFIAMPLGMGYTVEGQLSGEERFGGLQIAVYPARPGSPASRAPRQAGVQGLAAGAPDGAPQGMPMPAPAAGSPPSGIARAAKSLLSRGAPPKGAATSPRAERLSAPAPGGMEMGLGAGGRMHQDVYPDPWGAGQFVSDPAARIYIHIVNSQLFREITGRDAPPTPVSAKTYAQHGLPWFDLYDEHLGDVGASDALSGVLSVKEMDAEKGFGPQQDDDGVETGPATMLGTPADPRRVTDGEW